MPDSSNFRVAMISEHGDPLAPLGGQQSGGQNVYVYELAKALSNLGIKVDVFTRWDNRQSANIVRFAKRAKVIRLKAGPRHFISKDKFGPLMPEFVEHFLEYLRSNKIKYNLIHSNYYYSGWVGIQLKNILKIPLVHTYHSLGLLKKQALGEKDTSPDERIKIETLILNNADKIVSTSPQEKISMIEEYQAKVANIVVIPAGVNIRRFTPLNKNLARKKLKLPADKFIVVFAGKMERRKGGITLIKAVNNIKNRWPKIYRNLLVFMFSGDPRTQRTKEKQEKIAKHDLKNTVEQYKLKDAIKLLPGITQEKLHYYYGAANVVVMPSYYEPFGMVAVEAMATGTPVVASNVGGLKWIIEDNITGFHAEVKNPVSFARQIVKILSKPSLADRLCKNSIIRSRNNFSWVKIAQKILKVYKNLINHDLRRESQPSGCAKQAKASCSKRRCVSRDRSFNGI